MILMTWLLALGLAVNPTDQAAVALALAKAQRERPVPVKTANPFPPQTLPQKQAATHSHLCRNCGTEFWHADDSFGVAADHRCPNCGSGPWWTVYRRR
jgi:predicted RNA-binding Zn-ribbon protein involved in translation (DUF1610 family)